MRTQTLAAAGLLFLSATVAVGLNAQAPQAPPLPQPNDNAPDTLVQTRQADQAARQQVLTTKGASGRLRAMRAIVQSYFRVPARNAVRITNSEQLDQLDAEETAQFLTMLGYDPATLQSNGPEASTIVRSAAAVLFGRSTINDEINVSPVVVVARLKSVAPSALGDGYGSTASYDVVQSIKGSMAAGTVLQLRQRSGPSPSGEIVFVHSEFHPGMTGEYLLFVSPEMYRFRAANPAGTGGYVASFLLPYRVINGTAYPTGIGQQPSPFAVSGLGDN